MSPPAIESDEAPVAPARPVELDVAGMSCTNCVRHVAGAIQSVPGVRNIEVALDPGHASFRWSSNVPANNEAVLAAIKQAGYEATVSGRRSDEAGARDQATARWCLNLWIGVLATAPLMLGEWVLNLSMQRWFQGLAFVLAGAVQIFAGARFYRGAWRQLQAGRSNMDTLVALGSSTAFAYSAWAFFTRAGGHLYFMEAAAIITLISVGHWVEALVSARASSSLRSLLHLASPLARRKDPDGSESQVPVAALRLNDLVILKPGDRVPTDGEAQEGESTVDESMLTGESLPVSKTSLTKLFAGSLNLDGRLVMRVTATGEATALAHIIAAVQRAQASRANIQRIGDRVSSVFVPVVVLLALATGLWWGLAYEQALRISQALTHFLWLPHTADSPLAAAVSAAAAVLIVACPCAMGLATPAAIMAASNAAARRGILIRDGVALEKAGSITSVLFDKTGTLTTGKPTVVHSATPGVVDAIHGVEVSHLAAALARRSAHPLSQAMARLANEEFDFTEWREIRGAGIEAKKQSATGASNTIRLGSLKWLSEAGTDLSQSATVLDKWTTQGATVLGLASDKTLLAVFALKDEIKPGAGDALRQLSRAGLRLFLITGDNRLTAASVARQTGIPLENVFAEVRPEQKADFVRTLQQRGEHVAFVGDGINDAPALEQADLGIAVSRANDVAREAADIILLRSEIEAVPESLGLARATLRTIRQNLFWAFFYNAAGIPLAALGFMSPVLCAAAMGLSDLIVIGNALRLGRWKLGR